MYGLIDSGADDALFPLVIAARLGIDLAKCRRETCETAGGTTDQFIWDPGIEIEIPEMNRTRVKAQASFSAGLPSRIILLGRNDFFCAFRVYIDERAKLFRLEPY
jgi:hypothetical protein